MLAGRAHSDPGVRPPPSDPLKAFDQRGRDALRAELLDELVVVHVAGRLPRIDDHVALRRRLDRHRSHTFCQAARVDVGHFARCVFPLCGLIFLRLVMSVVVATCTNASVDRGACRALLRLWTTT